MYSPSPSTTGALELVEGAGNRFAIADRRGLGALVDGAAQARLLCRSELAPGFRADGLLVIEDPAPGSIARMVLFNRDGSRPEMCGNGLRCVALHLAGSGELEGVVATDAGPRAVCVRGGRCEASVGSAQVSEALAVRVADRSLTVHPVDVGNPHAVVPLAETSWMLETAPLARIAEAIRRLATFPEGVNVELAELVTGARWRVRVDERGVGETEACGTGAAAVVAALGVEGEAGQVDLPGGSLSVRVHRGELLVGGGARHVGRVPS